MKGASFVFIFTIFLEIIKSYLFPHYLSSAKNTWKQCSCMIVFHLYHASTMILIMYSLDTENNLKFVKGVKNPLVFFVDPFQVDHLTLPSCMVIREATFLWKATMYL